jgi:prophage antirepressor-like protein
MRGTVDEPLICAVDAAEYIGDTNYRRRLEKYTPGKYMQLLATTDIRGQRRQMQYFTEAGFYKYMLQSKGEKAEEFQCFVYELLKEERKKTVDSIQLALKIAKTEVLELRNAKASLERKQTALYRAANNSREEVATLKEEVKTLRNSKYAAADAEELRLLGRGGEQIRGWNC